MPNWTSLPPKIFRRIKQKTPSFVNGCRKHHCRHHLPHTQPKVDSLRDLHGDWAEARGEVSSSCCFLALGYIKLSYQYMLKERMIDSPKLRPWSVMYGVRHGRTPIKALGSILNQTDASAPSDLRGDAESTIIVVTDTTTRWMRVTGFVEESHFLLVITIVVVIKLAEKWLPIQWQLGFVWSIL